MTTKTPVQHDHPAFAPIRAAILAAHPRASKAREYKLAYADALIQGKKVKINRSYHNLILHLIAVRAILKENGVVTSCLITDTHAECWNIFV